MTVHAVVHDTIVVERRFDHPPARLFAAWADPAQRARWHVPGEDWKLASIEQDFRVGGDERMRFGPDGAARLESEGRFLDIVPDRRIVSAGRMQADGVCISATLCTVELAADGTGTLLRLTDQSAFFDGREAPADRRSGWGTILGRLQRFLSDDPERRP